MTHFREAKQRCGASSTRTSRPTSARRRSEANRPQRELHDPLPRSEAAKRGELNTNSATHVREAKQRSEVSSTQTPRPTSARRRSPLNVHALFLKTKIFFFMRRRGGIEPLHVSMPRRSHLNRYPKPFKSINLKGLASSAILKVR